MQSAEGFAWEWGVSAMHQEEIAKAIRARDAEWQALVDKAVDEAVSEARKLVLASEDYHKLVTMIESIHRKLEDDCDPAAAEEIALDAIKYARGE